MNKTKINSSEFAERMWAYSHGYKIEIGDAVLIFTTGQIAMDKDGNVLYPDDPAKQAEFVFESLEKILNESGASLNDVVKATVFVTNMDDFEVISKVRNKYFKNSEPVSTLVEVNKFVKEGCKVEIEVIAVKKSNS
ncbi:MAG: RidA family protein [Candidatus Dojkabacteria bacterium]|jgi:2-iminobutanoate/2-iminopropanoate deaminase|nr:RidA family protein [Candidatus Dojkabacteria bacterium]